jgi:hypothetical protein
MRAWRSLLRECSARKTSLRKVDRDRHLIPGLLNDAQTGPPCLRAFEPTAKRASPACSSLGASRRGGGSTRTFNVYLLDFLRTLSAVLTFRSLADFPELLLSNALLG